MKAVTKNTDAGNEMAAEEEDSEKSERPIQYASPASTGSSYFRIYKKGQGYWTRMGTTAAVVLIGLLSAAFIWNEVTALTTTGSAASNLTKMHLTSEKLAYIIVGAFCAAYALISFHYLNKVKSVDFLIATDSEMKKVNWTTKKELIGSTKVVIGFMFVIAFILFVYDQFFHWLFWLVGVLQT